MPFRPSFSVPSPTQGSRCFASYTRGEWRPHKSPNLKGRLFRTHKLLFTIDDMPRSGDFTPVAQVNTDEFLDAPVGALYCKRVVVGKTHVIPERVEQQVATREAVLGEILSAVHRTLRFSLLYVFVEMSGGFWNQLVNLEEEGKGRRETVNAYETMAMAEFFGQGSYPLSEAGKPSRS